MKDAEHKAINKQYDYLVVGAGLFGAVITERLTHLGKKVLVIDKNPFVGGNVHTEEIEGIHVHSFGAHIFHTSNKLVWNYVNSFVEFIPFINSPIANYKGELYNLPFNMNTFIKIFPNAKSIDDIKRYIAKEINDANITTINNLEEQAISMVGTSIYEKLIKGYTEKQWGKRAKELPASIIKRIPLRFTFDNNYFNDIYQGIPKNGYTHFIEQLLKNSEVRLNCDFFADIDTYLNIANNIIYTGRIDKFFDYKYGELEYRSVKFITKTLDQEVFQGVAVMNFTDRETPYTRIIEHKFFDRFNKTNKTIISYEYPLNEGENNINPCYPLNNNQNNEIFEKYLSEANKLNNIYFGGRLASYKYFDMDDSIEEAFKLLDKITKQIQQ